MTTKIPDSKTDRGPVSPELIKQWKISFKHGDKTRIAQLYRLTRQDVIDAFDGTANKLVITAINSYYGIKPKNKLAA